MRFLPRIPAFLLALCLFGGSALAQIPGGGGGGSGGNVNVTQWVTTNLAAPTAWGTAPAGGSIVPNMNVNCVVGCSGSSGTNITQTAGTNINATIAATGALPVDVLTTSNLYAVAIAPVPCQAQATWATSTGLTGTQATRCDGSAALWGDMGAWAGTALGAPSNYGTSPGAVAVPGVNAFITNTPGVSLQAIASGGWTYKTFVAANSDNATNLKNAAGIVHAVQIFGISAATPAWLKFYDTATTPTCASSTIVKQILIPAATTGSGAITAVIDTQFSTGVSYCVVTGIATSDDTAVAAATYVVNIDYK
jgi:hypothetical protein